MKVTRKQGFTLIELLVVIVIIGILAGALFGPITGALASARRSGMAQTGRQIVQAIITADSQGAFRGYVWPSDAAGRYSGTKPSNGPNMYQAFSTTEAYFTEALYMAQTNAQQREMKKVLKEIEPADLVADGYVEATGTTINEENCAWIIAKNVRQAPGNTPVLISRNFNCTNLINTAGDDVSADYSTLLTTKEPFGQDGCVVVYKDGSCKDFDGGSVIMRDLVSGLGSGKLSDIKQGDDTFAFLDN